MIPVPKAEHRAGLPAVRCAVEYDPPVTEEKIAEWQRELEVIAPRNEEISWLKIGWVSGDWWETNTMGEGYRPARGIGRFVVFQMTPRKRIPEMVLTDLEGPNPRTFGKWDPYAVCPECDGFSETCIVCNGKGRGAFVQNRSCAVNRYQWELFRETGAWGQMLWVCQGTKGGHLRRFTQVQSKVSEMSGGPKDPPAIGDLPYAEPDRRTFNALAAMDNVRKFDLMLDYAQRKPEQIEAEHQHAYEAMREQMWNFLSNQIESRIKDEKPFIRHLKNQMPVGVKGKPNRTPDEIRQNFIHRD